MSTRIDELVALYREGKTNLMPYGEVKFYLSERTAGSADYESHKLNLESVKKSKPDGDFVMSTRKAVTRKAERNSVGVIEELQVSIKGYLGSELVLTIMDIEAGAQLNKFLNRIGQRNQSVVTTYCSVRFGWLAAPNIDNIYSTPIDFMIKDINANWTGDHFTYTITGVGIVVPHFVANPVATGKFEGTVGKCLQEWQRVTNIEINPSSLDLIQTNSKIQTTGSKIIPAGDTPLTLLQKILKHAEPKKSGLNNETVSYYMQGDGVVALTTFSEKLSNVYNHYKVGHPTSTAISTSFQNDLAFSKLNEGYIVNSIDTKEMKITAIGQKGSTAGSTIRSQDPMMTDQTGQTAALDPKPFLQNYNTRSGTISLLGDPDLIPSTRIESGRRVYDFFNAKNPFLGIKVTHTIAKPSNFIELDTEPMSTSHWLDGIYRVEEVTHSINGSEYVTTLEVISDAGTKALLGVK